MGSNNEYEHQSFNNDLSKGWVTEYIPGWNINLTYNKEFINKFFGEDKPFTMSYEGVFLDFSK